MNISPEVLIYLNRICSNCGETFGLHNAGHILCPVVEGGRIVAYNNNGQTFNEWLDDEPSLTAQETS